MRGLTVTQPPVVVEDEQVHVLSITDGDKRAEKVVILVYLPRSENIDPVDQPARLVSQGGSIYDTRAPLLVDL